MKINKPPDKTSVLIVVILNSFLNPFMGGAINIALPQMGNELAMDAISLSWVATAYLLTSVIFILPFGRISDIYGRKKIFSWGMISFVITSLLLAIANSDIMLIALRLAQGAGGAMAVGTNVAMLTSAFPSGDRGRVLGFYAAAVYSGVSLGPFLGGILTENFGWRSIFIVTVIIGLIIVAITFLRLKGDWIEAEGEKFDIVGSIIYSLMIVALIYGFTHLPDLFGLWLILIGIAGFVVFVIWEMRTTSPVLEINIFIKNKAFAFSCLAALVNYGATFAVSFLLSLYLQYIKGFSPQNAGIVLVSQPIVQAIFSPIAGRISDRIQPRLVASAGMACTSIGLLLFAFLNDKTAILQIVASLILLGFGFGLFSSPNTNAAMSSVDKKFYGVASATIATMRQIGMILSMGIVMLLFALYIGKVQITPEYYAAFLQGTRVAFIIFAALCFFGIFASMARGKVNDIKQ